MIRQKSKEQASMPFCPNPEEIIGHTYETISVWLKRTATHGESLTQVLASDLHLNQVEIDEFWSFVQKNGAASQPDAGERWGCLVQDLAGRFVVASATGPLSEEPIEQAVIITVQRTHQGALHWFSNGWHGYQNILKWAYRPPANGDGLRGWCQRRSH